MKRICIGIVWCVCCCLLSPGRNQAQIITLLEQSQFRRSVNMASANYKASITLGQKQFDWRVE
jgi:hypothetical protein